jgi:hypothetical protein
VEGFLVHGKVYEYFGPLPALVRLPIAAATDSLDGRLGQLSLLAAFAIALTFTVRLASRLRPLVRGSVAVTRGERWAVGAFTFVVGAGSVLVFLAGRAWGFHEADLWGVALALGAFEYVIAFTLVPSRKHIVLASALTSAALLSRGSVGLGPLLALGVLLLASIWPRTRRLTGMVDGPKIRSRLAALLIGILVPMALYGYVNYAKFGTLFSIPFNKQLSKGMFVAGPDVVAANGGSMFNPKLVPTTALQYLRPDTLRLSGPFPWVTFGAASGNVGSVVIARTPTASYSASMPFLTVLGLVGLAGVVRPSRTRRPSLAALRAPVVGAIGASVLTFSYAYIAHRYLSDFVPLGVLAAIVGLHVVLRWTSAESRGAPRHGVWVALGLLAATSVWFNVGLGVMYGRVLVPNNDHDLAAFLSFQYQVRHWFPGGEAPAVRTGSRLPDPKHGSAFVIGKCDALYWSSTGAWRLLERSEGGGRFRLRVRFPPSPTGWEPLVVSGRGDRAQYLALRVLPGNRVQFAYLLIFAQEPVPIRPGHSYNLEVVMDATRGSPTEGTVRVTLDGRQAWSTTLPNGIIRERLRTLKDVTVGRSNIPGLAPRFTGTLKRLPAETSLCQKLAPDAGA